MLLIYQRHLDRDGGRRQVENFDVVKHVGSVSGFWIVVYKYFYILVFVGYREKGYPKQDPKNDCLDFVKIETS